MPATVLGSDPDLRFVSCVPRQACEGLERASFKRESDRRMTQKTAEEWAAELVHDWDANVETIKLAMDAATEAERERILQINRGWQTERTNGIANDKNN